MIRFYELPIIVICHYELLFSFKYFSLVTTHTIIWLYKAIKRNKMLIGYILLRPVQLLLFTSLLYQIQSHIKLFSFCGSLSLNKGLNSNLNFGGVSNCFEYILLKVTKWIIFSSNIFLLLLVCFILSLSKDFYSTCGFLSSLSIFCY